MLSSVHLDVCLYKFIRWSSTWGQFSPTVLGAPSKTDKEQAPFLYLMTLNIGTLFAKWIFLLSLTVFENVHPYPH